MAEVLTLQVQDALPAPTDLVPASAQRIASAFADWRSRQAVAATGQPAKMARTSFLGARRAVENLLRAGCTEEEIKCAMAACHPVVSENAWAVEIKRHRDSRPRQVPEVYDAILRHQREEEAREARRTG